MKPKFWNWLDDVDSGERTLMLNGTITDEAWFEDSVTPSQFRAELSKCSGDVSVWINSPGGGVLAAAQIYNMLMEYPGNVRVRIDGLAASAATIVAMAGNVVEISPVGCMFVHNPEAMSIGNASDHKLTIEMLSEIKECIINAYEIKTGRNRKELSDLMDSTSWMCAQKAVNLGFADKIMYWDDAGGGSDRMVKPSCFSAKIIRGSCGANYVKGMTRTNKHDGLVEHWYCYGKIRRRNCKAKNIRGDRLRKACCEVLGLGDFDEEIFGKTIDRIIVTDKLEFHFYDGTVKVVQIQFFKKGQGKYTDPHKKPFGYQWSNEKGYVLVPKEAEAVKLIFRYYLEGWQITDISKQMESDGYGSIRGRVSRKLVAYVLDSDFYLGIRRIKAQFSEGGKEEVIEKTMSRP